MRGGGLEKVSRVTSEGHAAGDFNALTIDPAILLGKQRGDHRPNVIG